jgi:hypothetical protein
MGDIRQAVRIARRFLAVEVNQARGNGATEKSCPVGTRLHNYAAEIGNYKSRSRGLASESQRQKPRTSHMAAAIHDLDED